MYSRLKCLKKHNFRSSLTTYTYLPAYLLTVGLGCRNYLHVRTLLTYGSRFTYYSHANERIQCAHASSILVHIARVSHALSLSHKTPAATACEGSWVLPDTHAPRPARHGSAHAASRHPARGHPSPTSHLTHRKYVMIVSLLRPRTNRRRSARHDLQLA